MIDFYRYTRKIGLCFLFLAIPTTLIGYNKIEFYSVKAPVTPLYGISRIAILNFSGEGNFGAEFSDHLIRNILSQGEVRFTYPHFFITIYANDLNLRETSIKLFDVVEREQLYQVFREQGVDNMTSIEDASALEIGRTLSVDAIIVGSVHHRYQIKHSRERRERTNKDKTKSVWYEDCSEVIFSANATARVIRVEDGEIIESFTPNYEYKNLACDYRRKKLLTKEQLIQDAFQKMSSTIAGSFVPGFVSRKIELEKIKEKSIRDEADKAAKLADEYHFDEAYTIYKKLYEQDSYNPKLAFNLGLLHEIHGNYDRAYELYAIALEIDSKERNYEESVARIEWQQKQATALAEYGFLIQNHSFEIQIDVFSEKIKVKGKDSERREVYRKPSTSSSVITKVPGGITLTVLSKEGDWYKVKLLGGKEGFVHRDQVED